MTVSNPTIPNHHYFYVLVSFISLKRVKLWHIKYDTQIDSAGRSIEPVGTVVRTQRYQPVRSKALQESVGRVIAYSSLHCHN